MGFNIPSARVALEASGHPVAPGEPILADSGGGLYALIRNERRLRACRLGAVSLVSGTYTDTSGAWVTIVENAPFKLSADSSARIDLAVRARGVGAGGGIRISITDGGSTATATLTTVGAGDETLTGQLTGAPLAASATLRFKVEIKSTAATGYLYHALAAEDDLGTSDL